MKERNLSRYAFQRYLGRTSAAIPVIMTEVLLSPLFLQANAGILL
jgi:hypothetical protein